MAALIATLEALQPQLPKHRRLIGIDLGTKTIGLALSDVERRIATPHSTLQRTKFRQEADALVRLATDFDAGALVVGLPLNMDGSEGPRAQSTRAFVRNLIAHFPQTHPVAMVFWDERLSTATVERELIRQDVSRKRRAAIIDQMAAAYILQGALDRLARIACAAEGHMSDCKPR